jgi:Concanavalin A-like lectin/glucanases superfamily
MRDFYGYDQEWAMNATQSLCPNLWRSLVALWVPSMGIQGSKLWDFSVRNYHATFNAGNGNSWVSGRTGKVLRVGGGGNDYLNVRGGLLPGVSQFSFLGWWNQTTLDVVGGMLYRDSATVSQRVQIETYSDGNLYVETTAGVTHGFFDYSTVISAGTWFHFAAVFDGTQATNATRLKVYVNGRPIALSYTGTIPANVSNPASTNQTYPFYYSATEVWNGMVDDLRLYHRALSQNEVLFSMYRSPLELIPLPVSSTAVAVAPTGQPTMRRWGGVPQMLGGQLAGRSW